MDSPIPMLRAAGARTLHIEKEKKKLASSSAERPSVGLLEKCMQVMLNFIWFVSQDHVERSLDCFLQCVSSMRSDQARLVQVAINQMM
jgi:hypothetical protein